MAILGAAQKSPEAFRTISEVAADLDVPQHVLRFWETKFATVKPLKRGGGRRYYRPDDLDLLRGIRSLLYSDGLTIRGVQKVLREQGPRYVMELGRGSTSLIASRRAGEELAAREEARDALSTRNAPSRRDAPSSRDAPSNVHQFPRDTEPELDLRETNRAHFTTLLDELLELKARLKAARPR